MMRGRRLPTGFRFAGRPRRSSSCRTGGVTDISLDHDLGDDERATGYDVILWIEEAVATRGFSLPRITVHSANSSARKKMELGIESIRRLAIERTSGPE